MKGLRNVRKSIGQLTTGTVGGAVIIIFLGMLLGDKAPWFVERLWVAGEKVRSITLNVEEIFDEKRQTSEIDPNIYHVDSQWKFYLKKPRQDFWEIKTANPGEFLDDISIAYVPFFNYSFNVLAPIFKTDRVLRDDITTTTFSTRESTYEIEFTQQSTIGEYPLILDPWEDPDFLRASLIAGASLSQRDVSEIEKLFNEPTEEGREFLERVRASAREEADNIIRDRWPETQTFSDNVTVTTFRKNMLMTNPLYTLLVKNTGANILIILNFLTYTNPELSMVNIKRIDTNKRNDVLLIDGSIPLGNILVNGENVPRCELVRLVLVAIKADTIFVVTMSYLYGVSARVIAKELESVFASFRIVD